MAILKPELLPTVTKWVNDFSKVIQDSTLNYAFFRAKVYCDERDFICMEFLAGLENGNFRTPRIEYDYLNDKAYYDSASKFNFSPEAERKVLNAMKDLVRGFSTFKDPISTLFFDISSKGRVKEGVAIPDRNFLGESKVYLVISNYEEDVYNISEAYTNCGSEFSGKWTEDSVKGY